MTREEALKAFQEAQAEYEASLTGPTLTSPGQAFVGSSAPPPVEAKPRPNLAEPIGEDMPGIALGIAAGVGGAKLGERALPQIAKRLGRELGPAARSAVRAAGSFATTYPTQLAYQNLRRAVGDEGAPDSFDQAGMISIKSAMDQAVGSVYGDLAAGATSRMSPRVADDEERVQVMKDMQAMLRQTYERIGGQPMVQDYQSRWSPMRMFRPLETELDNQAVVQRLQRAGLDPQMARKVVLQGAMTSSDLLNNFPYSIMQAVAESSGIAQKYMQKYTGTRNRLYELLGEDLGSRFATALPEEELGKAVKAAIDGNFNLPNAIMTSAFGLLDRGLTVPAGEKPYLFKTQGMKNYFKQQGIGVGTPAMDMIVNLPPSIDYTTVKRIRQNFSSIIHDYSQPQNIRDAAAMVAKTFDNSIGRQMPDETMKRYYHLATQADDVLHEGQFHTSFVKNLMNQPRTNREYAKYILSRGDVDSFMKLEAAAGRGAADSVRRSISDIQIENAINPQTQEINPASLHQAMREHGKYGEYFLGATLGPHWVDNVQRIQRSMELIQTASRGRSLSGMSLGSLKYASVAPLIYDFYNRRISLQTAWQFAALLFAPRVLAEVVTSPRSTRNIERLTQMAIDGQNPKTFTRLVARTAETLGMSPENLLAAANVPIVGPIQRMRQAMSHGRMPSTGSTMADVMLNPAGSMAGIQQGP